MSDEYNDEYNLKKFLDPDFPLLKQFRTIAPGSFKHCQNVSNFCEIIASELGLDVTFMKVCAMYHDIGKMYNPLYFSENQNGDTNPHDSLSPTISYQYITRHISDSILILLQEPEMPRAVMEVIYKHHGDTILGAIYNKALKNGEVNEELFRYKAPKPDEIYSCILMIVDCVEATARSLHNSNKLETDEDKQNVVISTIKRLREDEQLDSMTVGTLRTVEKMLIRELGSIYHKRVPYTTDEKISSKEINVE